MPNNLLNEGSHNKWSQIISEEYNISDKNKLGWMSRMASAQEFVESKKSSNGIITEGQQAAGFNGGNLMATPLNTMGMGNPMMPQGTGFSQNGGIGNTGADFHNDQYQVGSGDIPFQSTIPISLQVAAQTIGLELVPVIPSPGPYTMLTFMDFPYGGGKLGRMNETTLDGKGVGNTNKPLYFKVKLSGNADFEGAAGKALIKKRGTRVVISNGTNAVAGEYISRSRIDGALIMKIWGIGDPAAENFTAMVSSIATPDEATIDAATVATVSIRDLFTAEKPVYAIKAYTPDPAGVAKPTEIIIAGAITSAVPDFVATSADRILGFANFASKTSANADGLQNMTRAENETGTGNTIGARVFSKLIQMGALEVTGTVTRQQLQDMPMLGVDVTGMVLEQMQNELSQQLNAQILDRLFRMGVTNWAEQKAYQGVDLNLFMSNAGAAEQTSDGSEFAGVPNFTDIHNHDWSVGSDGTLKTGCFFGLKNAIQNTAAENITTHQRRITSRILAAANLVTNVSRRQRPNFIVCGMQILTALQDCSQFIIAPMSNSMVQDGSKSMYFAGTVAGLNVYCDPFLDWNDTRILIGTKGDGKVPGVVFMPYILADKVNIIAEGTMSSKYLLNSRFALADIGFQPEFQYYCFAVGSTAGMLV